MTTLLATSEIAKKIDLQFSDLSDFDGMEHEFSVFDKHGSELIVRLYVSDDGETDNIEFEFHHWIKGEITLYKAGINKKFLKDEVARFIKTVYWEVFWNEGEARVESEYKARFEEKDWLYQELELTKQFV